MAEVGLKEIAIALGEAIGVIGITGLGFVIAIGITTAVVGLL